MLKHVFDALKSGLSNIEWSISTLLSNVLELSSRCVSCDFGWVRRDANFLAQALAKYALINRSLIHCNMFSLPPSVSMEVREDGCVFGF